MTDADSAASALPVPLPTALAAGDSPPKKDRKGRSEKLRSAWISFVGRIVAQVVGATASVLLGVVVVQQYAASFAAHDGEPAVETVTRARSAPDRLAIAVLPLDNFSGDASQEFLANGLTEALIADLAQVTHVRVLSRTSATHVKGEHKPLTAIARELDADLVLEGSIVRSGNRVRVTAQLIDGDTDEHVWARTYERPVSDVLDVEATLAGEIARGLIESPPFKRGQ